MNPLRILCVMACLAVSVLATPTQKDNSVSGSLKPSQWLTPSELEAIPALDEISWQQLESMPLEKGARLMRKYYHLSEINNDVVPTFVPSPSNIPVYIFNGQGDKVTANLNNYVESAKDMSNFGSDEVTIFITGLPESISSVKEANKALINSYVQRYGQTPKAPQGQSANWQADKLVGGNLIVIDLGKTITDLKRFALLDTEKTGKMIAKTIVELTNDTPVVIEMVRLVAQGIAAPVAGSAGRQFKALTSHSLREITALDPANQFAKNPKTLGGLARGAAKYVKAIHTSALGMGTKKRNGDVDFYPNGPSEGLPGTNNVIEASMRATVMLGESNLPGNAKNFPAVQANSFEQFKNNNGIGKRAYMGIISEMDVVGDYMLEVNAESPFGKRSPARKQNTYHGVHQTSSHQNNKDY